MVNIQYSRILVFERHGVCNALVENEAVLRLLACVIGYESYWEPEGRSNAHVRQFCSESLVQ